MQFQVPQFIEIEDKIVGPFTFRQFIYLAGGAGLCFILYAYLPLILAIIPIIAVAALSISLTFYKYNGRDFIFLAESVFKYLLTKKLYLWKQSESARAQNTNIQTPKMSVPEGVDLPKLSASKLKDLSWSLDVQNPEAESVENNQL